MRFLPGLLLGLLVLVPGGKAQAGNLVSVRSMALPPPPAEAQAGLLVPAPQPLLVSTGGGWRLDDAPVRWSAVDVPPGDHAAAISNGPAPLVFTFLPGGTGIVGVAPLLGGRAPPPFPTPLQHARGAVLDRVLHVFGQDAEQKPVHFSHVLGDSPSIWREQTGWTADGAIEAAVAQDNALYIVLRRPDRDVIWRWAGGEPWSEQGGLPGRLVPGAIRAVGQAHLLFAVHRTDGPDRLATFHTITRTFTFQGGELAGRTLRGVAWRDGLILESEGGDGQPTVFAAHEIHGRKLLLGSLDWVVMIGYLAGMMGIGLYFYLGERKQTTADFFLGSRAIPFWAAGISLYATNTSSISYVAIPAKAFATNWQYLMNNLVAIGGLMFVAVWIVPLLRRLDLMSVFHYLEIRFHPSIRTLTSALCIAMQLGGRMSVVLFLPSLAISTITGLDVVWSILIMGTVTIGYTALGGMKAVIWTDCVQLIVMFGGAIFAIGFIIFKLDGGLGEFLTVSTQEDKMRLADWSFDLTKATVWGFIFLVLFDVVLTFPKDQVLMQRVLSTKSGRDASRSIWTFAAIMLPGGFMFYLIGTSLWVYYQAHPERMNPLLSTDATFPLFIAAELPVGVTGLIIAGIFAASMSTLSSIINSVATLASVDFYEKWARKPDPAFSVRVAGWMTVAAGLVGMGLALLLSRFDIDSLFDVSIELSGLLSGGFAGAYTLGMFTRRANWQGVAIGIGVSICLTVFAWSQDLVHPYFYMPISILICIVVGYAGSLFFPPPTVSLQGLTIFTKREGAAAPAGTS